VLDGEWSVRVFANIASSEQTRGPGGGRHHRGLRQSRARCAL
jgi:hypothetical protein